MSKYENNPLAAAVEKKAHLKKNISALVEQTQDASSSFNIALSALKNNQPETAIKKFMQVLEIDSSEEMERQVRPNLGQAYLQQNEYNTALAEFRRALKLNQPPEIKAFIYANLGYIYTQLNFYGFAIREYRQAVKENRKDTTSLLTLGMLYETSFRPQEATEVFEQVLKFDSENSYARESLERIAKARPVLPKEEIVRLVKLLPTLGIIVVMSYDPTYDGWFPMVIYIYPESPLQGKVQPGQKILSVFLSHSESVDDEDERELLAVILALEWFKPGVISQVVFNAETAISERLLNPYTNTKNRPKPWVLGSLLAGLSILLGFLLWQRAESGFLHAGALRMLWQQGLFKWLPTCVGSFFLARWGLQKMKTCPRDDSNVRPTI